MSILDADEVQGYKAAARHVKDETVLPSTATYGESVYQGSGAVVLSVDRGSVAEKAGVVAGMRILELDGQVLRDIIDWLWFSDGHEIELAISDGHGVPKIISLKRTYGQAWGINFADPLFDKVMTCNNACLFCFMTMLPKNMRPSLYLRDDDYRLSFLQGNFVTLSNLTSAHIERIIEQHVSPLHVSLHAVSPDVRQRLMGANHARGMEALEKLMAAGIEFHAQIVLMPGINDGPQLDISLNWALEQPQILSLGIVPYGYTRYAKIQQGFSESAAIALIEQVEPYQRRSREQSGKTRIYLADEWYLLANKYLPPTKLYDDFPQYEDGLGMLRSFVDDWQKGVEDDPTWDNPIHPTYLAHAAVTNSTTYLVTGEAFAPTLKLLLAQLPKTARGTVQVIPITNNYFGGNVNVAGLLTATDIIEQLRILRIDQNTTIVLPAVIFNSEGLTLDGQTQQQIAAQLPPAKIQTSVSAQDIQTILS